ncbi:TadE/TadG family type IV pilus assembly protein [Phyllobacterium sp. SB3]|uniref:TadE/TadG family type IV pilus assembly protein n=1 Tax=Phyllobacterium sp. SB3 TaxID=3156073 RepID=UPI0032AEB981
MKKIRNFLKDRSGATAVTFGLMLIPIAGVTGLAVDYTRASNDRSELQNAADAAVLSGAQIYDGKDLKPVDKRILESLRANITDYDKRGITKTVTEQAGVPPRIVLTLAKSMNTTFMKVLNRDTMNIGVTAVASSALTATDATFVITKVKGIYYKKISMIAVRQDGSEAEVASIEYTNPKQIDGEGVSVPKENVGVTFSLGQVKDLYFTMIVKKGGCGIGYKVSSGKCVKTNDASEKLTEIPENLKFGDYYKRQSDARAFLVKSNRANDAWRLALDGATTTTPGEGTAFEMKDLLDCSGTTKYHGWEDGGGSDPDFVYQLKTGCAYDYSRVILTQ